MKIRDRQNRLVKIAKCLDARKALPADDLGFLVDALRRIAAGEDANQALDVVAKRGERKGHAANVSKMLSQFAMGWIAAARLPEAEGGLGLKLEEACAKLGENDLNAFGLTEETLRTYWNKRPNMRKVEFKLED